MKKSKISIVLISVLFIPTLVLGNGSKVNACSKWNPFCREEKILQMPPSPAQIEAQAKKEFEEEQARKRAKQDEINRANKAEADRVAAEAERAAAEERALVEKAKAEERAEAERVEKAKAEERAEAERVAKAEADRKAAQAESDRNNAIVDGIGAFGRLLFPSKK
jgi:uncharacterized membrane protein YqiK